jgi:hypothetical protein
VIQPADKGSGICILDRIDYENEARTQLSDTLVDDDGIPFLYYDNTGHWPHDVHLQLKLHLNINKGYFDCEPFVT